MCRHGETETVWCLIPADLSCTGQATWRLKPIDRCIAPIVEALQVAGVWTRASCCGHGERPGEIVLQDGRVLTITGSKMAIAEAISLLRRTYRCLHRGQWEDGETDAELCNAINDYMAGMFGPDWSSRSSD